MSALQWIFTAMNSGHNQWWYCFCLFTIVMSREKKMYLEWPKIGSQINNYKLSKKKCKELWRCLLSWMEKTWHSLTLGHQCFWFPVPSSSLFGLCVLSSHTLLLKRESAGTHLGCCHGPAWLSDDSHLLGTSRGKQTPTGVTCPHVKLATPRQHPDLQRQGLLPSVKM